MKKGTVKIIEKKPYMSDYEQVLVLLYRPLIKDSSFMLYHLLHSFVNRTSTAEQLIKYSGLSEKRFEAARQTLEEFRLLKTYIKAGGREYVFEIIPPLSAYNFLKDNTFGRLMVAQLGSKTYDLLKLHFLFEDDEKEGMVEITKPFDSARLQNWNEEQEAMMSILRPNEPKQESGFDFESFLEGMDRIFPPRYRTKSNLDLIASLASIYGITPIEMKKYVNRSTNPHTHEFIPATLERIVHGSLKKPIQTMDDPYQMAPMHFFQSRQSAPIAKADENLIMNLSTNYGFSNEVVNILIEYTLEATNQKFQRAYVEKVASTWNRLKIKTRQEAVQYIESQKTNSYTSRKEVNQSLPEWYSKQESTPPDEELLAKALALQKKA
ncbi:hypothetical protein C815_00095 [Firmicutes bacterium M10-2]|nr:hypothetical protein C815_00095 [Firmicutes bacterium M10-2]